MSESLSIQDMPISTELNAEPAQNLFETSNEPENVEKKPVEDASKKPIDEKLSSKFAALSRKEKLLKQQEMQFKQQEIQLKQKDQEYQNSISSMKAELEKIKSEFEQYRTGIKQNPLKHLQAEGYDFDKLTEMQLNDQNPTPEMMLERAKKELESGYKSEIEKMRAELAEKEKSAQEAAEKAELEAQEKIRTDYQTEINAYLEQNAEKYELINLNNAQSIVYDVVEQFYDEHQRILTLEEAADFTEKYLEEEANKLLKAKKFNKLQQPQKQQSEPKESFTLSNDMSTQVPRGDVRKLSREEEIQEIAKKLVWE